MTKTAAILMIIGAAIIAPKANACPDKEPKEVKFKSSRGQIAAALAGAGFTLLILSFIF